MWFLRLLGIRQAPAATPDAKPTLTMSTGAKGAWLGFALSIVAAWEGLYTHAYRDPVNVVTICYGVTNADRPVKMGDKYTAEECKGMLREMLPKYDAMAKKCIPALDSFPPHRHAAIVSFTYNVGQGNLCKSSVARHLNAGNVKAGCDALLMWNKAGGQVLKGLDNRRRQEREWCLRSD
jgi:lysozyme